MRDLEACPRASASAASYASRVPSHFANRRPSRGRRPPAAGAGRRRPARRAGPAARAVRDGGPGQPDHAGAEATLPPVPAGPHPEHAHEQDLDAHPGHHQRTEVPEPAHPLHGTPGTPRRHHVRGTGPGTARWWLMGFTKAELESFRDVEVPDLLPPVDRPLRLLFVGINPGLWTAATQTHFARPGNRFYPALLRAGILQQPVDPSAGMTDEDRELFRSRGIGITNVVARATARADELTSAELRDGRAGDCARWSPSADPTSWRSPASPPTAAAFGERQREGRRAAGAVGHVARLRRAQPVRPQRPRHGRLARSGVRRGGAGRGRPRPADLSRAAPPRQRGRPTCARRRRPGCGTARTATCCGRAPAARRG